MRKYKETEETYIKKTETKVICDKCGREAGQGVEDIAELQEFQTLGIMGGYGSVFGDGVELVCDLCQHCIKELIGPYLREMNDDT